MRLQRIVLSLVLVAATVACAGGSGTGSAGSNATFKRGGNAAVGCVDPGITTLDPAKSDLGECQRDALAAMYDTLVQQDVKGNVSPQAAASWTIDPAGTQYTFTLRSGMAFHDGSPVTADAVKFSIERMLDPSARGGASNIRGSVSKVEVVDPTTIRLTLKAPAASLINVMGGASVAPIVNPRVVSAQKGDLSNTDAGSGPFVLDSYQPGAQVTFKRFESYWAKGQDGKPLPYLDGFRLSGIVDNNVRLLNLRSKDLDLAQGVDPQGFAQVKNDPAIQTVTTGVGFAVNLGINPNKPPFTNKLVRQALVHALDRKAIMSIVSFGNGVVRPTSVSVGSWGDVSSPDFEYDLNRAKAELSQAGQSSGFTITMSVIARQPEQQIAQIIQQQWAKINVTVKIEVLERASWIALNMKHTSDTLLVRQGSVVEPDQSFANLFDPTSGNNWVGWNDQQNQELWQFTRQALTTTDLSKRKAFYRDAVKVMIDACVYVGLGQIPTPILALKTFNGAWSEPTGSLHLTQAWTTR